LGSVALAQFADSIKNSGTILGAANLGDGNDIFTNFIKVGNHVKSGIVSGFIDLGVGDDHFNGGNKSELVLDAGGSDSYKLGGGGDTYFADGGGTGTDTIDGGKGVDIYDAQFATFSVLVNLDAKAHGGLAAHSAQGADVGDPGSLDTIIGFEDAIGSFAADLLIGTNGANKLDGKAGTDDLIGLGGRDTLFGGPDADRFIFQKLSDSGVKASTRDLILDFNQGVDHIVLTDLEASVGHAFSFIGTAAFHHIAGELRQSDSGANTIVSLDANGDGKADFSVELQGHFVLTAGDFTL
jgi:serralysin